MRVGERGSAPWIFFSKTVPSAAILCAILACSGGFAGTCLLITPTYPRSIKAPRSAELHVLKLDSGQPLFWPVLYHAARILITISSSLLPLPFSTAPSDAGIPPAAIPTNRRSPGITISTPARAAGMAPAAASQSVTTNPRNPRPEGWGDLRRVRRRGVDSHE